jgi:hypothetical protein
MFRIFSAAALIVACAATTPALAVHHSDYRAQSNGAPYSQDPYQNSYDENPAFTQGCPRGAIPESFPNGIGRRCALPGGGYSY